MSPHAIPHADSRPTARRVREIYVSTDIETDGPVPGRHSLLSIASAAFKPDGRLLGTFTANLDLLPGAHADPKTTVFWQGEPAAWAACRLDPRPPGEVFPEYAAWLKALPAKPVFVGFPVAFDYPFVQWYLARYAGEDPFRFAAIDVRSYAMGRLGTAYRETGRHMLPKDWLSSRPHTHIALDDAIEQGEIFCNMLRAAHGTGAIGDTTPNQAATNDD